MRRRQRVQFGQLDDADLPPETPPEECPPWDPWCVFSTPPGGEPPVIPSDLPPIPGYQPPTPGAQPPGIPALPPPPDFCPPGYVCFTTETHQSRIDASNRRKWYWGLGGAAAGLLVGVVGSRLMR